MRIECYVVAGERLSYTGKEVRSPRVAFLPTFLKFFFDCFVYLAV